MPRPLNVLIVDDSVQDALLILRELQRGRYAPTWERVTSADEMCTALEQRAWDLVLADYLLERFSAPEAFRLLQERGLDLPFIVVAGSVGDEAAVEALRAGIHDYVVKDNLSRLVVTVERELREASVRGERRRMQEQLLISDRMVSVGQLAAGVAHEINNPLAAVMANLQFALQYLSELDRDLRAARGSADERVAQITSSLGDAFEASERVRQIARDLKTFSWSAADERADPVDVERVLDSCLRMARNEIHHRARLVKDYGNVPPVLGSESHLGQIFLNLIVNAAQAVPEGRSEANEIHVATRTRGSHVMVEIRDTGFGIPSEMMPRVFDPFFPSKPRGVGPGLGLAICRHIVSSVGGEIEVESAVGEGTTFRVALPVAPQTYLAQRDLPSDEVTSSKRGVILIVEDQIVVANALVRLLSAEHDVTCVSTSREALVAIESGRRFDVILCDLMMPDMTGMDLFTDVARSAPHLAERMVFMTGGVFTPRAREFLERVPNPRIEKPFDWDQLRATVRKTLGS
jgi:signal transduction histidine kinase